ncbi:hypothetical protein TNCV_3327771 [Trichonephila clavipes]|nr:hypothetical protein TNCV_3327771 [Trichonephila clavipes]
MVSMMVNPPTGQHGFFCPTSEASKTDHTEFFDEDHELYAAQRYPTHVQSVTYPANTQAKEEALPAANQDRI